ncbi:DUF559 domain-containing protein [Micromonospora zingiberis]|uniref:DUF559 domain-containing protein n=1 Tax=Micromonospora zingiberis TaxID=2053011 RepID=A0A4R0GQ01_9ACTN|nr:DUF559 domain-containing protein [Micromonospora zingiberis]TCB99007.1 DUF559 domain-containing protein [Micromonospora zingiberis]
MPPLPYRPAALAWQVFRGSEATRDGLLTRHQLRGASWVRLMQDVYADARLDRDHELRCRAACLRLPPGVVIAGPSAAYLHGIEHAATFTDDVHVLAPMHLRPGSQRGIRVHTLGPRRPPHPDPDDQPHPPPPRDTDLQPHPAPPRDPVEQHHPPRHPDPDDQPIPPPRHTDDQPHPAPPRDPVEQLTLPPPTTAAPRQSLSAAAFGQRTRRSTPSAASAGSVLLRSDAVWAAWECAVWLEPVRAVGIIDALLGRELVDCAGLDAVASANASRPGGRRARWVFGLADAGAQSPPESQLRVRLILAGLPRPVTQHPVRLPNGRVLHLDLCWPEYRVAVEYDGHWHSDPERMHLDRQRLNQLVGAGWQVLHVTSRRLHRDFPRLLREIRTTLAAAGWRR